MILHKIKLLILTFLFILPYFIFTPSIETEFQREIYFFFSECMKISIGKNGDYPFYTLMTSVYVTVLMVMLLSYFFVFKLEDFRYNYEFQQNIYNCFFKKNNFITITLLSYIISLLGVYHFTFEDISDISFRKDLIYFLYNNKIGIIVMEIFFSFLTLYFLFYLYLVYIYFFNILKGLKIYEENNKDSNL